MKYTRGDWVPISTPECTSEIVAVKVLLLNNEVLVKGVYAITGAIKSELNVFDGEDHAPISAGEFEERFAPLKSVGTNVATVTSPADSAILVLANCIFAGVKLAAVGFNKPGLP